MCRQSLISAAELLSAKASKRDSQLFLVRHMLVLKEMAGALSTGTVPHEKASDSSLGLDVKNVTSVAGELQRVLA